MGRGNGATRHALSLYLMIRTSFFVVGYMKKDFVCQDDFDRKI